MIYNYLIQISYRNRTNHVYFSYTDPLQWLRRFSFNLGILPLKESKGGVVFFGTEGNEDGKGKTVSLEGRRIVSG